jgi:hypothetical protein
MIIYVEFICKYSFAAMDDIGCNEHATRSQFNKFYSCLSFDLLISIYTNKESTDMFKQSHMKQLCVKTSDHSQGKATQRHEYNRNMKRAHRLANETV